MPGLQPFGRRGQRQYGIDLIGPDSDGNLWAVQYRLHEEGKRLSERQVEDIVSAVGSFPSPLHHLVIATTAKRDANLQQLVLLMNQTHRRKGRHSVEGASWDDVQDMLNAHPAVADLFYGGLSGQQASEIRAVTSRPEVSRTLRSLGTFEALGFLLVGDPERARKLALELHSLHPKSALPHSILVNTAPAGVSLEELEAQTADAVIVDDSASLALAQVKGGPSDPACN